MVVAALISAVVLAAPPQGFYEAKVLEPAASFVAGRPATVRCALSWADWNTYAGQRDQAAGVNGFTDLVSEVAYLSPIVCQPLRQQLRRKKVETFDLAAAVLILTHESIHVRGIRDEGRTECAAMHEMPRVAVKFFHVKAGKQLRALMAQAWKSHRQKPAVYSSVC